MSRTPTHRTTRWIALALAAAAGACGHPEKRVVDQYFNAVNANDTQTLSSFAVVHFDTKGKPVQNWKIVDSTDEQRATAPLPELLKRLREAEAAVVDNRKAAGRYSLDHAAEWQQVDELVGKRATIPGNLQAVAAEYRKYAEQGRTLARAVMDAKAAVEKERRNMALSLGTSEGLDDVSGEMVTKRLHVAVDHGGETKDYDMTLRKYQVSGDKGPRVVSRWMVYSLQPKA